MFSNENALPFPQKSVDGIASVRGNRYASAASSGAAPTRPVPMPCAVMLIRCTFASAFVSFNSFAVSMPGSCIWRTINAS